jgi:hypothetical protein
MKRLNESAITGGSGRECKPHMRKVGNNVEVLFKKTARCIRDRKS